MVVKEKNWVTDRNMSSPTLGGDMQPLRLLGPGSGRPPHGTGTNWNQAADQQQQKTGWSQLFSISYSMCSLCIVHIRCGVYEHLCQMGVVDQCTHVHTRAHMSCTASPNISPFLLSSHSQIETINRIWINESILKSPVPTFVSDDVSDNRRNPLFCCPPSRLLSRRSLFHLRSAVCLRGKSSFHNKCSLNVHSPLTVTSSLTARKSLRREWEDSRDAEVGPTFVKHNFHHAKSRSLRVESPEYSLEPDHFYWCVVTSHISFAG